MATKMWTYLGFALLIVLMLLLYGPLSWAAKVIPADLVQGRFPGQKAYTVHVFVGTPPESLHFEVSFKNDLVILYRDQRFHSVTYSTEGPSSSEIFYFGSDRTRLPVVFDPDRALYGEHSHCSSCDGMLGFGRGSVLWQRWSGATFTPASVTLGGLNPLMQFGGRGCSGSVIECDAHVADMDGMCLTKGYLENYLGDESESTDGVVSESDPAYPIVISIDSPFTYLPRSLYDRYMRGKNIYADSVPGDWEPLRIRIIGAPLLQDGVSDGVRDGVVAEFQGMGLDVASCNGEAHLVIDPETLVKNYEIEGRSLLLKENPNPDDNTITLGNAVWAQFIFHREASGQYVYIQHHTVHSHLSPAALFIFAALLWYLVRWKMTDINMKTEDLIVPGRINWLNAFYEYTAPFLALAALLMPVARDVVGAFPLLYALSVLIFAVAAIVDLFVISAWIIISLYRTDSGKRRLLPAHNSAHYLRRQSHNMFRMNFLRNVTHETLLMIGMWVVLTGRRTEGIASVLTVIVNFYNLYNITFHLVLFITYTIYAGKRDSTRDATNGITSLVWSMAVVTLPLMFGFQVFASYTYFTAPLLMRQAQFYEEIILPSIALIYVVIVSASAYMVMLYMRRAMLTVVQEELASPRRNTTRRVAMVVTMKGPRIGTEANGSGGEDDDDDDDDDDYDDDPSADTEEDDESGLVKLVDKGLAVIIGLVSNFVFGIINLRPNRLELAVLVILVFLVFAMVYSPIISGIKKLGVLKRNKVWQDVLVAVLNFVYLLGIFLVLEMVLELIKEGIGGSDPNLFEVGVGIYALMLTGFSVVHSVKALT